MLVSIKMNDYDWVDKGDMSWKKYLRWYGNKFHRENPRFMVRRIAVDFLPDKASILIDGIVKAWDAKNGVAFGEWKPKDDRVKIETGHLDGLSYLSVSVKFAL